MKLDESPEVFADRHIGPGNQNLKTMLNLVGADSMENLIEETLPASIRLTRDLSTGPALSERDYLTELKNIIGKNKVFKSFIGQGYYGCHVPAVIQRNILENPGWYTQYTPYQSEISQGRMQALLNFQTMVNDLTGMQVANASLLDEGTAAAEAMFMLWSSTRKNPQRKDANVFRVAENCFTQTIDVLKTRAEPLGIEIEVSDPEAFEFGENVFGVLLQYPDREGKFAGCEFVCGRAKGQNCPVVVAADIMSLLLLKPPGEFGADVVVGSTQRLGVPMGFGGPHAAYFATRENYKRQIPGRIIGVSKDSMGQPALRMALQTREQHIRRERATSNICTAQVLLAVMSSMYAVYHGPVKLKAIATRIHFLTGLLAKSLMSLGFTLKHRNFFDTLFINLNSEQTIKIRETALARQINFNYPGNKQGITLSLDETTNLTDIENVLSVFSTLASEDQERPGINLKEFEGEHNIPENNRRTTHFLEHPVFNSYHSETEMMRYIKKLETKDLSLNWSMIPLGSCTMKLNAVSEMIPLTWRENSEMHPFAPEDQTLGYQILISKLADALAAITGLPGVSFQPNAGSQGEFAGLLVIRAYHHSRGDEHRKVILIPSSAHGTNPASAALAGMEIVIVKCDVHGNIDLDDLKHQVSRHSDNLAGLMVTYPSTHGVFEDDIQDICAEIHSGGGLVYMDGANMNAQVGLSNPNSIGADVCHLNLHKTFSIPHGGGGPGMGPICVTQKLMPFLPGHSEVKTGGENAIGPVAAAPFGSGSILCISWGYIRMLGAKGMRKSTEVAILNANYLLSRLKEHYPILYMGKKGRVAHEFILDFRPFKQSSGIEVVDVAKRLMDYGFHAPTVSFPVAGTLMIEPTESESLEELDRFCDALISIRGEIQAIEDGKADRQNNLFKNAPHTIHMISQADWPHEYTREQAVFPLEWVKADKFWPASARIDNTYGDKNLICNCLPVAEYSD